MLASSLAVFLALVCTLFFSVCMTIVQKKWISRDEATLFSFSAIVFVFNIAVWTLLFLFFSQLLSFWISCFALFILSFWIIWELLCYFFRESTPVLRKVISFTLSVASFLDKLIPSFTLGLRLTVVLLVGVCVVEFAPVPRALIATKLLFPQFFLTLIKRATIFIQASVWTRLSHKYLTAKKTY